MLAGLKRSAEDLARRSALGLAGGLLLLVAVGFLTAAAWQGLVAWNGPMVAALVLAAAYAGVGLILLALARSGQPAPPRQADPMERVVAAFFDGVDAGVSVRRPRGRHG